MAGGPWRAPTQCVGLEGPGEGGVPELGLPARLNRPGPRRPQPGPPAPPRRAGPGLSLTAHSEKIRLCRPEKDELW